jgi:hypothetical protein
MTAPTTAASNGHDKPRPTAERARGMTHVQQAQAYHLASLAHDAAFEAESLCNQIYRTASDGYLREPASETPGVATDPAMTVTAKEGIACLATALIYLIDLFGDQLTA